MSITPLSTFPINNQMIPDEITLIIFGNLSDESLETARRVCKHWEFLASLDSLWAQFALTKGFINKRDNESYRLFYKRCILHEDFLLITKIIIPFNESKIEQNKTQADLKKLEEDLNIKNLSLEEREIKTFEVLDENTHLFDDQFSSFHKSLKSALQGKPIFSEAKKAILLKFLNDKVHDLVNQFPPSKEIDPEIYRAKCLFGSIVPSGAAAFLKELVKKKVAVIPFDAMSALSSRYVYLIENNFHEMIAYLADLHIVPEKKDVSAAIRAEKLDVVQALLDLHAPMTSLYFNDIFSVDVTEKRIDIFKCLCRAAHRESPKDWEANKEKIITHLQFLDQLLINAKYMRDKLQEGYDAIHQTKLYNEKMCVIFENAKLSVLISRERAFSLPKNERDALLPTLDKEEEALKNNLVHVATQIKGLNEQEKYITSKIESLKKQMSFNELLPNGFIGEMRAAGLYSEKEA
jgi:hypothetical protein